MKAWRQEIDRLVAKLEELTGNKLTAENLAAATAEVNGKRRALQRLNAASFEAIFPSRDRRGRTEQHLLDR